MQTCFKKRSFQAVASLATSRPPYNPAREKWGKEDGGWILLVRMLTNVHVDIHLLHSLTAAEVLL